jgi:ribose transport system permease protein
MLIYLIVLFSVLMPSTFFTEGNVAAMLSSQAVLLILALAVTVALRSGAFDLSVSAVMVFSAAVIGVLTTQHHIGVGVAIVIALVVALGIGLINSSFIVGLGLDAFIVTLGMMTALTGLGYAITGTQVIINLPSSLVTMSSYHLFGLLPVAVFYGWALALVLWYVFERTPLGRNLLFVGGNSAASRLIGLPVRRIQIIAFVLAAVISGIAGVVLAGTLGAVDPSVGSQYLLQPYAAAFLGATTIQPGRFNILGTVIGLYLLIVGITGLELAGAATWVADVFNGAALVVAILFARLMGAKGGIAQ